MKLKKIVRFKGEIYCVSGLSIGGSSDTLEIGGLSKEVIKNPITKEPYIPGSSLKGKMRSVMEKKYGAFNKWNKPTDEEPCGCGKSDCSICKIYGAYKNTNTESAPTRIIVRDAVLSEKSKVKISEMYANQEEYLERKTENIVLRKSGTAGSPRIIERVPAGMTFDFEIILSIYDGDNESELIDKVKEALNYVEQSYLGGGGSRGSGEVKFIYEVINS